MTALVGGDKSTDHTLFGDVTSSLSRIVPLVVSRVTVRTVSFELLQNTENVVESERTFSTWNLPVMLDPSPSKEACLLYI